MELYVVMVVTLAVFMSYALTDVLSGLYFEMPVSPNKVKAYIWMFFILCLVMAVAGFLAK